MQKEFCDFHCINMQKHRLTWSSICFPKKKTAVCSAVIVYIAMAMATKTAICTG